MKGIAVEKYGSKEETYLYTSDRKCEVKSSRTDFNNSWHVVIRNFFESAFLPQGYPDSVSEDYLEYQIWDTAQAFCSSITGMLATQAVLKSYGVGDESATVLAASLTWMLKDGAGMVGRILFAWLKGTQLDCDAKRWRLHADVLNDAAIFMDLLAPLFKSYFILIACVSSIFRSVVGVAGGATRAALTLHQARRDNMADVSAKDGSQETLVNLMALVSGFVITPIVSDKPLLVWILFIIFTFFHLFSNYRAVSTVIMETINLPRLFILLTNFLENKSILSPKQVSRLDPVLRAPGYRRKIKIGCRLGECIKSYKNEDFDVSKTNSMKYVIGYCPVKETISVALHRSCSNEDIVKASFQCLLLDVLLTRNVDNATDFHKDFASSMSDISAKIRASNIGWDTVIQITRLTDQIFQEFRDDLKAQGWDLQRCHLGPDEWRFEWEDKTL